MRIHWNIVGYDGMYIYIYIQGAARFSTAKLTWFTWPTVRFMGDTKRTKGAPTWLGMPEELRLKVGACAA